VRLTNARIIIIIIIIVFTVQKSDDAWDSYIFRQLITCTSLIAAGPVVVTVFALALPNLHFRARAVLNKHSEVFELTLLVETVSYVHFARRFE